MSKELRQPTVLDVVCPVCGAAENEECLVRRNGKWHRTKMTPNEVRAHQERVEAFRIWRWELHNPTEHTAVMTESLSVNR